MIAVKCDKCNKEIIKKGAILWSPPDEKEMCKKTHLCIMCYADVLKYIEED